MIGLYEGHQFVFNRDAPLSGLCRSEELVMVREYATFD